jgi:hypothetical protein
VSAPAYLSRGTVRKPARLAIVAVLLLWAGPAMTDEGPKASAPLPAAAPGRPSRGPLAADGRQALGPASPRKGRSAREGVRQTQDRLAASQLIGSAERYARRSQEGQPFVKRTRRNPGRAPCAPLSPHSGRAATQPGTRLAPARPAFASAGPVPRSTDGEHRPGQRGAAADAPSVLSGISRGRSGHRLRQLLSLSLAVG